MRVPVMSRDLVGVMINIIMTLSQLVDSNVWDT